MKFTGDERDTETNLDHTWFRQNSSALGRWMTPDPGGLDVADLSNPQSWNRYGFVLNSPLRFVDWFGLCPDPNVDCVMVSADPPPPIDPWFFGSGTLGDGGYGPNTSGGSGGSVGGSNGSSSGQVGCSPPTSKFPTTIGVSAGGTVARNINGTTSTASSATTVVASLNTGAVGLLANVGAQNLPSAAPPGSPVANGQFAGAGYQIVVSNLQPNQLVGQSTSYQISLGYLFGGATVAYSKYPNGGYKLSFTPPPGLFPLAFGGGLFYKSDAPQTTGGITTGCHKQKS